MATAFENRREQSALPGRCDCEGTSMAVAITCLTTEGCVLEANDDWAGVADFVHLQIASAIDMNGKLDWAQGRRAQMRFFGQVHPAAIAKLHA
ncbi:hypothetical protein [Aurantiacibacter gilvus]|uniref:Uncharacterized protein n=1 Tax=Aurantiacibacter gilvus TaxID=3139141 RepID=A0ABU9II91_9SPHN